MKSLEQQQGILRPLQAKHHLSRDAAAENPVGLPLLEPLNGPLYGHLQFSRVQGCHHACQFTLSAPRLQHPIDQNGGGERTHQEAIQGRLRSFHRLRVGDL